MATVSISTFEIQNKQLRQVLHLHFHQGRHPGSTTPRAHTIFDFLPREDLFTQRILHENPATFKEYTGSTYLFTVPQPLVRCLLETLYEAVRGTSFDGEIDYRRAGKDLAASMTIVQGREESAIIDTPTTTTTRCNGSKDGSATVGNGIDCVGGFSRASFVGNAPTGRPGNGSGGPLSKFGLGRKPSTKTNGSSSSSGRKGSLTRDVKDVRDRDRDIGGKKSGESNINGPAETKNKGKEMAERKNSGSGSGSPPAALFVFEDLVAEQVLRIQVQVLVRVLRGEIKRPRRESSVGHAGGGRGESGAGRRAELDAAAQAGRAKERRGFQGRGTRSDEEGLCYLERVEDADADGEKTPVPALVSARTV